jgi:hypothetical protein
VTRFCSTCRLHRPMNNFDLDADPSAMCRSCAREKASVIDLESRRAGFERHEQIAALESQRLTLLGTLKKIDGEIADPHTSQIAALKKQRRSLIASIMKLDAEIVACAHGVARRSMS